MQNRQDTKEAQETQRRKEMLITLLNLLAAAGSNTSSYNYEDSILYLASRLTTLLAIRQSVTNQNLPRHRTHPQCLQSYHRHPPARPPSTSQPRPVAHNAATKAEIRQYDTSYP